MNKREIIIELVKAIAVWGLRYYDQRKQDKKQPKGSASSKNGIDEGYGLG